MKLKLFSLLLVLVLLTGCIDVHISHKLKRTGKVDLSIAIETSPQLKDMMSEIKNNLRPVEGSEYSHAETENSVSYYFTDLDPLSASSLFSSNSTTEGSSDSILGFEYITFTKEDKFPFYEYEYSLNLPTGENASEVAGMFNILYDVEVFGTITETNGQKLSDNKASFQIDPVNGGRYYVKFRDPMWNMWSSSDYKNYFIALILILVAVIGLVAFLIVKKQKKSSIHPPLLNYINSARQHGLKDDQIRAELFSKGWKSEDIERALRR